MKLLVMGCGGIGGIATAALTETGHDVVAYTTNADIAGAVERNGLQIRGDGAYSHSGRGVRARVVREIPRESFDAVLLCTQPPQVEDAARAALPVLAEDGVMVCLQNGLCEPRISKICGEPRTVGAVVAWGAAMPEPGVYERTAHGGFAIGTLQTKRDLSELARVLEAIGPVEVTENLAGKRWSKLAINAAISSLGTIGGDRLGAIMQHRFVRRLALEIMTECVHVARKCDVKLEKVSGTVDLEWLALTPEEKVATGSPVTKVSATLVAKHAMLLAVGFRYRRMRSSMLAAIERGRTPAVDFLNGEVVDRGREHGIATPVNEAARAMVWSIAKGEHKSSVDTLRELARLSAV